MSNRDMIEAEQDALRREAEEMEQKLHLLVCARQQEYVSQIRAELLEIRQRIEVSRQEEEKLAPERDQLGRTLYGHYKRMHAQTEDALRKNREQYEEFAEQASAEKEKLAGYEQSLREEASRQGALKSRVESYDRQEEQYNRTYGEQLARCLRLYPHRIRGEGHFLALLKKEGETSAQKGTFPKPSLTGKLEEKAAAPWKAFASRLRTDLNPENLRLYDGKLYWLPDALLERNIRGLRFLRTGLYLGDLEKNRFVPSQAMAMALRNGRLGRLGGSAGKRRPGHPVSQRRNLGRRRAYERRSLFRLVSGLHGQFSPGMGQAGE